MHNAYLYVFVMHHNEALVHVPVFRDDLYATVKSSSVKKLCLLCLVAFFCFSLFSGANM